MGYAVSMPSPLGLLMSGWALLGATALIRERSRELEVMTETEPAAVLDDIVNADS